MQQQAAASASSAQTVQQKQVQVVLKQFNSSQYK
jgi:hypothetical protein